MHLESDGGGEIWGLVLAGGDGNRLAAVARDATGAPAPKQYCALAGERTLFARTVDRLARLIPRQRLLAVVNERHRRHWFAESGVLAPGRFVVQPHNRGTAAGILLPLLELAALDPQARVVLCPSDHHVRDERALLGAIAEALSALERPLDRVLLIGIAPDLPDGELGWIVPGRGLSHGAQAVERFVEKPGADGARELAASGGVWNSFLIVSRVGALLDLIAARLPQLAAEMTAVLGRSGAERDAALAALYDGLASIDFSREVLQGAEGRLGVVVAPPCGWTDLGTPERLRRCSTRRTPAPLAGDRRGVGTFHGAEPALAFG